MNRQELVTALKSQETQNLIGTFSDFMNIMADSYACVIEESIIQGLQKYAESKNLMLLTERNEDAYLGIYNILIKNQTNGTELSCLINFDYWSEMSFNGDIEEAGIDDFCADFKYTNSDAEIIDTKKVKLPGICTENANQILETLIQEINSILF